ncbi:hypothetical protein BLNAU_10352 [Blattamonas nauphoetae]|uniref:Uncharacterized protein n=1 Tax=Blattamonas nauphoetae TaxID=2049346 RepID=A0ABQ9XTA5_9EUKA|nr:hypothetical protein BLNAU_10352 [Blattamonas nauphoetae]
MPPKRVHTLTSVKTEPPRLTKSQSSLSKGSPKQSAEPTMVTRKSNSARDNDLLLQSAHIDSILHDQSNISATLSALASGDSHRSTTSAKRIQNIESVEQDMSKVDLGNLTQEMLDLLDDKTSPIDQRSRTKPKIKNTIQRKGGKSKSAYGPGSYNSMGQSQYSSETSDQDEVRAGTLKTSVPLFGPRGMLVNPSGHKQEKGSMFEHQKEGPTVSLGMNGVGLDGGLGKTLQYLKEHPEEREKFQKRIDEILNKKKDSRQKQIEAERKARKERREKMKLEEVETKEGHRLRKEEYYNTLSLRMRSSAAKRDELHGEMMARLEWKRMCYQTVEYKQQHELQLRRNPSLWRRVQRFRTWDSVCRLFARLGALQIALREYRAVTEYERMKAEEKLTKQDEWRMKAIVARNTNSVASELTQTVLGFILQRKRKEKLQSAEIAIEFFNHVRRSGHMVAMLKKYRFTVIQAERMVREFEKSTVCRLHLICLQFEKFWLGGFDLNDKPIIGMGDRIKMEMERLLVENGWNVDQTLKANPVKYITIKRCNDRNEEIQFNEDDDPQKLFEEELKQENAKYEKIMKERAKKAEMKANRPPKPPKPADSEEESEDESSSDEEEEPDPPNAFIVRRRVFESRDIAGILTESNFLKFCALSTLRLQQARTPKGQTFQMPKRIPPFPPKLQMTLLKEMLSSHRRRHAKLIVEMEYLEDDVSLLQGGSSISALLSEHELNWVVEQALLVLLHDLPPPPPLILSHYRTFHSVLAETGSPLAQLFGLRRKSTQSAAQQSPGLPRTPTEINVGFTGRSNEGPPLSPLKSPQRAATSLSLMDDKKMF